MAKKPSKPKKKKTSSGRLMGSLYMKKKGIGTGRHVHHDRYVKERAVQRILEGRDTIEGMARQLRSGKSTVEAWVRKAKALMDDVPPKPKEKPLPQESIVLKPTALISDRTIKFKLCESHGHLLCNACLNLINEKEVCVVLSDPRKPPDREINTYCVECFIVSLNETQQYLAGLKELLLKGDKVAYVDLSNLHNNYNCIYKRREVRGQRLRTLNPLTKKELIEYLAQERVANLPDRVRPLMQMEKSFFEENDIPKLLQIKLSAFKAEEILRLKKEEGLSVREISRRLDMATHTIAGILNRNCTPREKTLGKVQRLERENRQLRKVLSYFAKRFL
jgi:transposase-like protein